MNLQDLVDYLDNYLNISGVPDYPNAYNGLQVYGPKDVRQVAVAVDATLFTITEAAKMGAELLICTSRPVLGLRLITGTFYDRISTCIKNDLAVYSVHLPLDVHPDVGNNYGLMRRLGFEPEGTWAPHMDGMEAGVWSSADVPLADLIIKLEDVLGPPEKIFTFGNQQIMKFGVITGGAGSSKFIRMAKEMGLDLLITGEGGHSAVYEMEELAVNCIYAGHYLTETVGVQSLAEHLESQFGLDTFFIDHPSGL